MIRRKGYELDRGSWIAMGLAAAAAVLYLVFFFVPQMRATSASLAELEEKLTYILLAQKSGRATEQIEQELDAVQAYVDQHDDQVLEQNELATLFSQISYISKSRNAVTTQFEPLPPTSYDSVRTVSLRLGVKGEFSAVYDLVRDLEGLPTRIWIDDMKFRGESQNGEDVKCDLLLVVFVDNPEKSD
jgi:Tfp pilus assembly protein PilO